MKIGRFHIHWVDNSPINVKFHVVNFTSKSVLDTDEKKFNKLLDEGYRVSERFLQESAVVYELWGEGVDSTKTV